MKPRQPGRQASKRFSVLLLVSAFLTSTFLIFLPGTAFATGQTATWTQPGASRPAWNYSADSNGGQGPTGNISLSSVAYGNGIYVAVGDGTNGSNVAVQTSPDGITWTSQTAGTDSIWTSVAFGNGLFVAVGVDSNWTTGIAMSSPDGIAWTQLTLPQNEISFTSITYGHGHFVGVGYGLSNATTQWTISSADGISWSLGTGGSDGYWRSVTYGNGIFVVTGQRGSDQAFNNVMTSSDYGATWILRATPQDQLWASVTFGNNLFVAVSQFGVMTSSDGITWNVSPSMNGDGWSAVTFGNGKFVMSGYGNNYQGIFAVSSDAQTWKYQTTSTPREWTGAVWGSDKVVFVNYNGAKLYSSLVDSVPSYELVLSNLDFNSGQPVPSHCDSCGNYMTVQFQRSDYALLDVQSLGSIFVGLSADFGGITAQNNDWLLPLDSSGKAIFNIYGPGDGSSVGMTVTFHAAITTGDFAGLAANLGVGYVADDQSPTVTSVSRSGGQLVTITKATDANPDMWDLTLTVDQSNTNVAGCAIDSSQPLSIYPQNGSPYTEQFFASGAWTNPLTWHSAGQDFWAQALFRDLVGLPEQFLIPTLVDGCSYTLTVSDYRQQFEPTATVHQFTYRMPLPSNSDASLASGQIKNVVVQELGTASATLPGVTPALATIPEMVSSSSTATTVFTPTQNTASIDKVVKFAPGSTISTTTFNAAAAYNNENIVDGDSLVVRVSAQDGSKLYYRINTTVDSYSALDFYLTNAAFGPTVVGKSMTQDVYINKNLQHSDVCGCGFFNPVIANNSQDYTIDANYCDPNSQIYMPGDTCKLVITFHPTQAGQSLARLSVLVGWDGDMGQEYLTIRGSGLAPPAAQSPPFVWSSHGVGSAQTWNSIASSADGTQLAAVIRNGHIYTSSDSGAHWTDRASAGTRDWYSIASSADGSHLAATSVGGDIYTSTDFGVTWVARAVPQSTDYLGGGNGYNCWVGITSSSDGMHLAAIDNGCSDGGNIFTSSDGGATWVDRSAGFGQGSMSNLVWNNIASSNDGMHLVATNGNYPGFVYFSGDGGATWNQSTTLPPVALVGRLASNSDGSRVLAIPAVSDWNYPTGSARDVFLSTDFGKTWTNVGPGLSDAWNSIATNYDGSHIAISSSGGFIHLSKDFGATWETATAAGQMAWGVLALSADGNLVTGAGTSTDIWTLRPVPAPPAPPAPSPPATPPPTPPAASGSASKPLGSTLVLKVYFDSLSYFVKGDNLKKLQVLAKTIANLGKSITITVTGYTQPSLGPLAADALLSKNRAAAVAKVLKKFGVNTIVISKGAGRAALNISMSRYAQIVVTNS